MLTDLLTSLKLMCTLHYVLDHVAKLIQFLQSCNKDVNVSQCVPKQYLFSSYQISISHARILFIFQYS